MMSSGWPPGVMGAVVSPAMASVALKAVVAIAALTLVAALKPSIACAVVERLGALMPGDTGARLGRRVRRWVGAGDTTDDGGNDPEPEPTSPDTGRRDLIIVALVASVVAVAQVVWIWKHRSLGTLDWDESRYVAGSFRFQRMFSGGFVGENVAFYGPAVPFWSGLTMLIAPLDPEMAISSQVVFAVGTAVAVTGVARRLTNSVAAIFCGILVSVLPATIASSQVYLLVPGAAFGLTAGIWALLASDHGNNRRIWLVGPLFALAPMSRGMTLAMLPAAYLATLVHVAPSTRGLRRAAMSLSAVSIGVCLYLMTWGKPMIDYIVGGLDAEGGPSPALFDRVAIRFSEVHDGLGQALVGAILIALVGLAISLRRNSPFTPIAGNPLIVVMTLVFGGGAALLLGGYRGELGFWDYPLIPLLVVLLVSFAAQAPRPLAVGLGTAIMGWMTYLALVALWILPFSGVASVGLDRYRAPLFASYKGWFDPRFTPARRDEQQQAAREWDELSIDIDERLRRLDEQSPAPLEVYYRGGSNFIYHTSAVLAAKDGREPVTYFGEPLVSADGDWADVLVPRKRGAERVLLIPEISPTASVANGGRTQSDLDRALGEDNYRAGAALRREAEMAGWRIIDRVPMPLGDTMLVYADPK